jgi:hypothetical protein
MCWTKSDGISPRASADWVRLRGNLVIEDNILSLGRPAIFSAAKIVPFFSARTDALLTLDSRHFGDLLGGKTIREIRFRLGQRSPLFGGERSGNFFEARIAPPCSAAQPGRSGKRAATEKGQSTSMKFPGIFSRTSPDRFPTS